MAKQIPEDSAQLLRERFSGFVSQREGRPAALLEIIQVVRQRGLSVFAFGGIPRGVLHNGRFYQPRDLDLVFDDQHFEFFESAFENNIQRRNSYGGLRLRIKGLAVDAWPLSATWAFRTGLFSEATFERLPHTTFLNADGIIVELSPNKFKSRRIYEAGFFSAWSEKVLSINLRENPFPAVCVARTLCISRRFGFKLSHSLATYLWEMLETLPMNELLQTQLNHYGAIEFSAEQFKRISQRLKDYFSTASFSPFAIFPSTNQLDLPFPQASCVRTEAEAPEKPFGNIELMHALACGV